MQKNSDLLSQVAKYYSEKVTEHGPTPRGVDWNGEASQLLRFQQLCRIIATDGPFTINDLGCGYGALYGYLESHYGNFSYEGIDVSQEMVQVARHRLAGHVNAKVIQSDKPRVIADFGVASGIFNVRLDKSDSEWRTYLEATLDALNSTSRIGFSFNCLTSYSDTDKMHAYLYYADPCQIFDLCKRRYSRNVALLHDYDLYEFVILVRKQL